MDGGQGKRAFKSSTRQGRQVSRTKRYLAPAGPGHAVLADRQRPGRSSAGFVLTPRGHRQDGSISKAEFSEQGSIGHTSRACGHGTTGRPGDENTASAGRRCAGPTDRTAQGVSADEPSFRDWPLTSTSHGGGGARRFALRCDSALSGGRRGRSNGTSRPVQSDLELERSPRCPLPSVRRRTLTTFPPCRASGRRFEGEGL